MLMMSLALYKLLFNVILDHFHEGAVQTFNEKYMHWQLAQLQNQNINSEIEIQVKNNLYI